MSSNGNLIYSYLKEYQNKQGWDKLTVKYCIEKPEFVKKSIQNAANKIGKNNKISNADIEDIYGEVLMYFYNVDDYEISKAVEYSKVEGSMVTIEGYINTCIRNTTLRYLSTEYNKKRNKEITTVASADQAEVSILSLLEDEQSEVSFDKIDYKLDDVLKQYESERYVHGEDFYFILFVRVVGLIHNIPQSDYERILEVLSIDKKQLMRIYDSSEASEMLNSIGKAVSHKDLEEVETILKEYVRDVGTVYKVIEQIKN